MNKYLFLLLTLVTSQALAKDMTNADIEMLIKANMNEAVIISTIEANASNNKFDTSAAALIGLKQMGASDKVLAALLKPSNAQNALINDKADPRQPAQGTPSLVLGRILLTSSNGSKNDLLIEHFTAYRKPMSFTGGENFYFKPAKATIRVIGQPAFEHALQPMSNPSSTVVLLRLDSSDLVNDRRTTSMFKGRTSFDIGSVITLEFEASQAPDRAGSALKTWRSKPQNPLPTGEYAIYFDRNFYTFGVD